MVEQITDTSLMPFGKYRGYKMTNVPPSYLIFIYENFTLTDHLKEYIGNKIDSLRQKVKLANKAIRK
jgi:uncharacterized protein (DUF3820 family)